jgi:YfiH family protein
VTADSLPHPPCLTAPALHVRHGFFTREGGVSVGPYASLNGSLSGGDDRAAVLVNRGRVAAALQIEADRLLGLTQVHGTAVVPVSSAWPAGAGPEADAMVSSTPGIGLVIITADCASVLLADAQAGVIGAAHAGWRGALAGVLEATVAAMNALGARSIAACVGPCIAQDSYQVGADLYGAVTAADTSAARFFRADGPDHWRFDLPAYCAARLTQAGVAATQLHLDTCADPKRFFSHRRRTLAGGGKIGHQMSAISL